MLVEIPDIWPDSTRKKHADYVELILDGQARKRVPWGSRSISEFVERNRLAVSVGSVSLIVKAIKDFEITAAKNGDAWRSRAIIKFNSTFDYSKFSKKATSGWCAYDLCRSAKYHICPYCQQSYAMTVVKNGGERVLRPTLDHYYPKSRFPFLSISLFNLIPSCYTCNSSLKGSIDFYNKKHFHPFVSSSKIGFCLDMDRYAKGKASGEQRWVVEISADGGCGKRRNSIKTFAIKERYDFLDNEISRFAESAYQLYCVGTGRYAEIFSGTGVSSVDAIALNFDEANFQNEMLGRLKKDLVMQIRAANDNEAL